MVWNRSQKKRPRAEIASATKPHAPKQKRGTTLTLNADELTALTRYLAAGKVLLQTEHPVLGRIKGAISRLGLTVPSGL